MRRHCTLLVLCLFIVGCEGQRFGAREGGALAGGAIGAGLGAIIGNQTGSTGAGIAIGSAVGALSGAVIGDAIDTDAARLDEQDSRIAAHERELRENARLIDELKRAGLDVEETSRGTVVRIPDVLFEFDSADLTSSAGPAVGSIARLVQEGSSKRVSVEGHTDSVGGYEYNQRLSEARARRVANALVERGISRRRLAVKGLGESNPVASNSNAAGRAKNRRVEVVIER